MTESRTSRNGEAGIQDAVDRALANAAKDGVREVPVAQGIPPSPVPMALNLAQFQAPDGSVGVVMEISTPTGVAVYFMTPDGAASLGEQLVALGTAGRAGVIVPG